MKNLFMFLLMQVKVTLRLLGITDVDAYIKTMVAPSFNFEENFRPLFSEHIKSIMMNYAIKYGKREELYAVADYVNLHKQSKMANKVMKSALSEAYSKLNLFYEILSSRRYCFRSEDVESDSRLYNTPWSVYGELEEGSALFVEIEKEDKVYRYTATKYGVSVDALYVIGSDIVIESLFELFGREIVGDYKYPNRILSLGAYLLTKDTDKEKVAKTPTSLHIAHEGSSKKTNDSLYVSNLLENIPVYTSHKGTHKKGFVQRPCYRSGYYRKNGTYVAGYETHKENKQISLPVKKIG